MSKSEGLCLEYIWYATVDSRVLHEGFTVQFSLTESVYKWTLKVLKFVLLEHLYFGFFYFPSLNQRQSSCSAFIYFIIIFVSGPTMITDHYTDVNVVSRAFAFEIGRGPKRKALGTRLYRCGYPV